MFANLLISLGESRIGTAVAESPTLFPWIEVVHVIGIATVVGTIMLVDLRLLGVAALDYPFARFSRTLLPLTWIGFLFALGSGLLLFSSQPVLYWENWYFRAKMLLLLLAGLNRLLFHFRAARGVTRWERTVTIPAAARMAGAVSLVLWVLVVAAGRWIGFTMTPF